MGNINSSVESIDYTEIPNLPDDSIVEILSKLPVYSLSRFKTVSNPWKILINSHVFIYKHQQLGVENNDPVINGLSLESQCFAYENLSDNDKQIASYFILNYRTKQVEERGHEWQSFRGYVKKLRISSNRIQIVALLNMVDREIMKGIRRFEEGEVTRVVLCRAAKGALDALNKEVKERAAKGALNGLNKEVKERAAKGALDGLNKEEKGDSINRVMEKALIGAVGEVAKGAVDDACDRIEEMPTDEIIKYILLPWSCLILVSSAVYFLTSPKGSN